MPLPTFQVNSQASFARLLHICLGKSPGCNCDPRCGTAREAEQVQHRMVSATGKCHSNRQRGQFVFRRSYTAYSRDLNKATNNSVAVLETRCPHLRFICLLQLRTEACRTSNGWSQKSRTCCTVRDLLNRRPGIQRGSNIPAAHLCTSIYGPQTQPPSHAPQRPHLFSPARIVASHHIHSPRSPRETLTTVFAHTQIHQRKCELGHKSAGRAAEATAVIEPRAPLHQGPSIPRRYSQGNIRRPLSPSAEEQLRLRVQDQQIIAPQISLRRTVDWDRHRHGEAHET